MHQILGLRPWFDPKKEKWDKTDKTYFKKKWRFSSIPELFANLQKYIDPIPEADRWNLYYTVAFCGEGKREFREQSVIIFDIDAIDNERINEYVEPLCACLGVDPKKTGVVASGNGLHIIIEIPPFGDPHFFDNTKLHYNAICTLLKTTLEKAALPGEPDPSVWEARRIMRLPGTENRKDGKPSRPARILQGVILPQEFDLASCAGLPKISAEDQISTSNLHADTKSVLAGCDFLKWCKENPADVSEAQWYATLSILPRLPPNGRLIAHEYSQGHPGYSYGETEAKIDQALAASAPRKCKNIQGLWPGCPKCPNFEKVTSPITIESGEYIKTKDSGFHAEYIDQNGNTRAGKPCYEDLRRYYEQQNPYVILGESGICLKWSDTHWIEEKDRKLENFAYRHFEPKASTAMRMEFKNLICCTNLRDTQWFTDTISGKLNFRNGIYDLQTMQLVPHSSDIGFRYRLDYDYDPEAKCPQFEKFLMDITYEREDLVNILIEYMGYSFSNEDCWAQKALILSGHGANGKSTFVEVLKALSGKANYAALMFSDLKSETNRNMLDGKLFNIAEETPTHAMLESSMFKNLVGGGEITVKVLYKQPYTINNKAKLIFACNELPRTSDTTEGFFRRLIIVPFDRKFEGKTRDSFIKKKLMEELPGIFNLVIRGYRRLSEQQEFTSSSHVDKQLEDYRETIDTIRAWYNDSVTLLDLPSEIRPSLSHLYQSYRVYAETRGEHPETQATMARRLKILMPDYRHRHTRIRQNGRREATFAGVRYADGTTY